MFTSNLAEFNAGLEDFAEREVPEFGRTLGQELLEPTRLYTRVCLATLETLSSPAAPAGLARVGMARISGTTSRANTSCNRRSSAKGSR